MRDVEQEVLITRLRGESHLLAVVVRARTLGALDQLPLKFSQSLPAFLSIG
jgi:hypothetical protein